MILFATFGFFNKNVAKSQPGQNADSLIETKHL